jgi:cytochrome c oxidase subunit 2
VRPGLFALLLVSCSSGGPATQNPSGGGDATARGEKIYDRLACAGCHHTGDAPSAPALFGRWGARVELEGGGSAVLDEAYLEESLFSPEAKLTRGFRPSMPSYRGKLERGDVADLAAYLRAAK